MIDARYFSSVPHTIPGKNTSARATATNALPHPFGAELVFLLRLDDVGWDINTAGN
jgi:hypothetical protein